MPGVLKLTSGQWYRTKTPFIFLSVSGTCLWVRLPLIILLWLLLEIAKNSGKSLDHSTRLCLLSSFLLSMIPVPETHSVRVLAHEWKGIVHLTDDRVFDKYHTQKWICGIYCAQMTKQKRGFTLASKPMADINRSWNQWYQWPHKKD